MLIETRSLFFSLKTFCIHERKIGYKKDCQIVNMESMNGKILDVGSNNTVTIPLTKDKKKIVPFLEVLESLNAVLARAYSYPQILSWISNSMNTAKNSWEFCDILPYSLWSLQIWYKLRLPKILVQQTRATGLYYKTVRLPNYFDIEESMVLHFFRLLLRRLPCLPLLPD